MMTQQRTIQIILAWGLCFFSMGGWLLHMKIHPPAANPANTIPFILGIISTFVLPLLFLYKKTLHAAYVFNGMTVIIGAITMAHFSLTKLPDTITLSVLLLQTTFPDIILLAAKFAIGLALFEISITKDIQIIKRSGRFWRYPNMGWWWIHLLTMAAVYSLGSLLWS